MSDLKILLQWQSSDKCLTYVIYRWIYCFFYAFSFVYSIIWSIYQNKLVYSLTHLTRWNLLATFITSIISADISTLHYRGMFKSREKMSSGMKIYWFMYNNVAVFACFITVFYWNFIYDNRKLSLNNALTHIANCVGPLIDLMIVDHPYYISHCIYPMMCAILYLIFTFIYQVCGGMNEHGKNNVYDVLDWKEKPIVALVIAVIAIAIAGILHTLFFALHCVKIKIHSSFTRKKFVINY